MIDGIDPGRIPRHVAIVMDGNGRWAQKRGLKRTEGHAAGEEALFDTVEGGLELGLPVDDRVRVLDRELAATARRGPVPDAVQRVVAAPPAGRPERAGRAGAVHRPARRAGAEAGACKHIEDTEALTARNRRMTLTFAFNYGGRAELTDAVQAIAREVSARKLKPDQISDRTIARHLYAPDMPDPDLMVRTSGEYRISNYLLWQSAYSEFLFTDVLWPDFRREHLFDAVREFQRRDRRFGTV